MIFIDARVIILEVESVTQRVVPELGRVASVAIPTGPTGEEGGAPVLDLRQLRSEPGGLGWKLGGVGGRF